MASSVILLAGADAGASTDADSRPERLRAASAIRRVFAARHVAHGSAMTVYVCHRGDAARSRAAVVAGKKVGGAVQRNAVKRRLRAALVEPGAVPAGLDMVVVARSAAVTAGVGALTEELGRLVVRATQGRPPP